MIMPGCIFFGSDDVTVMFSQDGVIKGRFAGREKNSQAAALLRGSHCERCNW